MGQMGNLSTGLGLTVVAALKLRVLYCFLLFGVIAATSTAGADFERGLPRFFLVLSIPVQNHKERK